MLGRSKHRALSLRRQRLTVIAFAILASIAIIVVCHQHDRGFIQSYIGSRQHPMALLSRLSVSRELSASRGRKRNSDVIRVPPRPPSCSARPITRHEKSKGEALSISYLQSVPSASSVAPDFTVSPYAPDVVVESDFIEVAGGGKMFYTKIGSGPPIIVAHGGPGLDHRYLASELSAFAKNHTVIFYDQRGSGRSHNARKDDEHITIETFVDDLEGLRRCLGYKKFTLMGHSWGGLLSMYYACAHPDRISSLILINSAPADQRGQNAFDEELGWRMRHASGKEAARIDSLSSNEKFHSLNATDIGAAYRALFGLYVSNRHSAGKLNLEFDTVAARSGFAISQKMEWSVPRIDLLTELTVTLKGRVPTLILHGFEDVVPSWTSEEISWAIADSKLVLLENCGHFPFVEAPGEFTAQVNDFLDQHRV
mmetsp:Transcript_2655/g.4070  ORF Transcript_2655/g.4070 Transcript_2655/m.4070 type:complete len:425 (+) Transcript_2655:70-1344(+)